jgi:hypothetical protein
VSRKENYTDVRVMISIFLAGVLEDNLGMADDLDGEMQISRRMSNVDVESPDVEVVVLNVIWICQRTSIVLDWDFDCWTRYFDFAFSVHPRFD